MKLIICIALAVTIFTGCDKETEKYADSCTNLWNLSPKSTLSPTDDFIIRCCELIDGGDNPGEQSSEEGTCMVNLLSTKSATAGVIAAKKEAALAQQKANESAAGSMAKVQAAFDSITKGASTAPVKETK